MARCWSDLSLYALCHGLQPRNSAKSAALMSLSNWRWPLCCAQVMSGGGPSAGHQKSRTRFDRHLTSSPSSIADNLGAIPGRLGLSRSEMDVTKQLLCRRPYRMLSCLAAAAGKQPAHDIRSRFAATHIASRISARLLSTAEGRSADDQASRRSTASPHQQQPLSSLLDGALNSEKGVPTVQALRRSRHKARSAQPQHRNEALSTGSADTANKQESSINDLFNAFNEFSDEGATRARGRGMRFNPNDMAGIMDISPGSGRLPGGSKLVVPPDLPVKLGPPVGRTVDVLAGNPARALKMLSRQLRANHIKREMVAQKFHERPGLKRKRIAKMTWRTSFKHAFIGTVAEIKRMKRQGW